MLGAVLRREAQVVEHTAHVGKFRVDIEAPRSGLQRSPQEHPAGVVEQGVVGRLPDDRGGLPDQLGIRNRHSCNDFGHGSQLSSDLIGHNPFCPRVGRNYRAHKVTHPTDQDMIRRTLCARSTTASSLTRLEGLHNLVARRLRVRTRMFHRRRITTADMPARQTQPQVHPAGAGRNTVLAALAGARWGDQADVLQVRVAEDGCHGRALLRLSTLTVAHPRSIHRSARKSIRFAETRSGRCQGCGDCAREPGRALRHLRVDRTRRCVYLDPGRRQLYESRSATTPFRWVG